MLPVLWFVRGIDTRKSEKRYKYITHNYQWVKDDEVECISVCVHYTVL